MPEPNTGLSAGILELYFPRIRKTAKRKVMPRVQARAHVGDDSFVIDLTASLEGLRLLDKLSLPLLGHLFKTICDKTIEHAGRKPKPGRSQFRTDPVASEYDAAIKTAKLLGPPIWRWLNQKKKSISNADRLIKNLGSPQGMDAKNVLATILQTNWENENGHWPGAEPRNDSETFFKRLNKYDWLTHGYSLLPLPPASKLVKNILNRKKAYNYQLRNGQVVLPEHLLPPLHILSV